MAKPFLSDLASRIEAFLRLVEKPAIIWSTTNASELFEGEDSFKKISIAWCQITGMDFLADALSRRREQSPAAKLSPPPYSVWMDVM